MVAEGPGHRRDTLAVYEESGLADVLTEDRIPFHDLNYMTGYELPNAGRQSSMRTLTFPALFQGSGLDCVCGEDEDSPLGRSHAFDEEFVRRDAGHLLWLA